MSDNGAGSDVVLRLAGVVKRFGSFEAVRGIDLEVHRGEIFTLLGPSGCGKSTTLRLIMGLEQADGGTITFDGRPLDGPGLFVPPHRREMGLVFQSYAVWPHLTVFENVAYPLNVRRVSRSETRQRVDEVLELVGLQGLGDRPATALSGGQQQRVALARALVFKPTLLLLDEPFSNLDAKLRDEMRAEVKALQRTLGLTTVFVTHDQTEALALSDRIALLDAGVVAEVAHPKVMYTRPATSLARDFIGQALVLSGLVETRDEAGIVVRLDGGERLRANVVAGDVFDDFAPGTACEISTRPEKLTVAVAEEGPGEDEVGVVTGTVLAALFHGDRYVLNVRLSDEGHVLVYGDPDVDWREGIRVVIAFDGERTTAWPATERVASVAEPQ